MSATWAVQSAVMFVWLGMVLAISFLEAPLKFQAPGVTLQIGLGIGRLVFRALNAIEAMFAVVIVLAVVIDAPPARVVVPAALAIVALAFQIGVVRPRLARRSNAVLAGQDAPRSRGHYGYVGLEALKVVALLVAGTLLLVA